MKKVFLDTNIILDYYLGREGFSDVAETLLTLGYNGELELYVSVLSLANIAYIARKKFPGKMIYTVLETLQEFTKISSVDSAVSRSAINLRAGDFEDALQYFSASSAGVDYIVTRNVKDFSFSRIKVLTPSDFLDKVIC